MRIGRWLTPLALIGLLGASAPALALDEDGEKEGVKLPKAVRKTVKARFPEAKIRGTSKEKNEKGQTVYEVEMVIKKKMVDVIISAEGKIEEIEKQIDLSDLPSAVTAALFKAYPKAKIEKVEELTGEDDKVLYEVVLLSKGKKTMEVVIVPNGKILETVEAAEDDDKPKAKKKEKGEDDDEDDKPKAKKKEKGEDDDEDDDKPKAKKRKKGGHDKEMDDDDDENDDDE